MKNDAAQEVEETLSDSRDDTERRIANYRVGFFLIGIGIALLISSAVSWVPVLMCVVGTLYSIAVRLRVRRQGSSYGLMVTVIVVDVAIIGGMFVLARLKTGVPTDVIKLRFAMFMLPAALFCLMVLNTLRYSRTAAVVGGVAYQACFWSVENFMVKPFHISMALAAVLMGVASVLSFLNALRAQENLDHLARLQLLRRYLPATAVRRVLNATLDQALSLGGEQLTVTLLSADLRGFTAMSERLTAEQVVVQLNEYHGAMLEQIENNDGVLDKFIGDGTLAVFGLDTKGQGRPEDQGASAAVACATGMLAALTRVNVDRTTRGQPALRMGVGIHTGPVVAGNIGAPRRRLEFTVIGDSVNTASRLEGLTKETQEMVLVSAETVSRLPNRDGVRALPAMHAKGKDQLLEVYALVPRSAPVVVPVGTLAPAGA
jgi:adenylate cyclase